MHSDLEEGEIRDDGLDIIEGDVNDFNRSDSIQFHNFSTKINLDILPGNFGKIPIDKGKKVNLRSHLGETYPTQKRQNAKTLNTYADDMEPSSKDDQRKKKAHSVNVSKSYNGNYTSKRPRSSSAMSDCSCSSCENDMKSSAKIKSDHYVKENKTNHNYRNKSYHHRQRYKRPRRTRSKCASINEHKKGYYETFAKSVTEKNSLKVFIRKKKENLPILKAGADMIKPGSIGEILLTRKRPIEITLSDTEQASSSKVNKPSLSDDEDLLMLRKRALDSRNLTSNENKCNSPSISNVENTLPLVEDQTASGNKSVEVHNEVVDMEISISDDDSNSKDKKEFPIEWAYMMPPPAGSKSESDLQSINRWCYNQNLYIQAMESKNELSATQNSSDPILESSKSSPKYDCDNEILSKNSTDEISHNAETFLDANLIGGHAKQYHDFMANFYKDQHHRSNSNYRVLAEVHIEEQTKQQNLIEIPLEPLVSQNMTNAPTSATDTPEPVTTEAKENDEYDEDMLLATLLIDQEKRAQKRQDYNKTTGISKHSQPAKKKHKKLINLEIKNTGVSHTGNESADESDKSKYLEFNNYKFPKVKPIIISLQSDSDSEGDQASKNSDTSSNIDQFIRNIRNSNASSSAGSEKYMKSDEVKTPEALVYLSKTQQEDYKLLRGLLHKKITNKTQLFKKSLPIKKSKNFNKSPNKNMPPKYKRKLGKFNFAMNKSANPKVIVNENITQQKSPKQCEMEPPKSIPVICKPSIKETESRLSQTSKYIPVVANKDIFSTNPPKYLQEIASTAFLGNEKLSQVSHNCNPTDTSSNDDEELALRKFLLQSLKAKSPSETNKCQSVVNTKVVCNETVHNSLKLGAIPENNFQDKDRTCIVATDNGPSDICAIQLEPNVQMNDETPESGEQWETPIASEAEVKKTLSEQILDNVVNNISLVNNVCEDITPQFTGLEMEYVDKTFNPTVDDTCLINPMDKVAESTVKITQLKTESAPVRGIAMEPQIKQENACPSPKQTLQQMDMRVPITASFSDNIRKKNIHSPLHADTDSKRIPCHKRPAQLKHSIVRKTGDISIKEENIYPPVGSQKNKRVAVAERKLATTETFKIRNVNGFRLRKENAPPLDNGKNKTEKENLLKHIEQEVVRERNKVFSTKQKLSEDIKNSERFFTESKSISVLISSLKSQLHQAENNYSNKLLSAARNVHKLLEKKAQLKKHINVSRELQQMGEKLGKQIVDQNYTFPPPSSNYDTDYAAIESDIQLLKTRVHKLPPSTMPQSKFDAKPNKGSVTDVFKKSAPAVKDKLFKIDNRTMNVQPASHQATEKEESLRTKIRPTLNSLNPESSSDTDVLCPHDLLGRCNDESCIYIHLQTSECAESKPINSHSSVQSDPKLPAVDSVNDSLRVIPPLCSLINVNKPTYQTPLQSSIKHEPNIAPVVTKPVDKSLSKINTAAVYCADISAPTALTHVDSLSSHECEPIIPKDISNSSVKLKRVSVRIQRLSASEISPYSKPNTIKCRLRNRRSA